MLVYVAEIWPPTFVLIGALVLVVLGLRPDQGPALYLTAVGLGPFMSAIGLFVSVFSQRRPQPASGPAELPAAGGSSAWPDADLPGPSGRG